jgi:LysR family glycine cleavage system transcriptional activator
MVRGLPPLSAFRSFEAVARQLSFSKAAEELHVTPGAVSQQIRSFEDHLGARLFDRTRRSVALTELATRILPDVQAGLATLGRTVSGNVAAIGEHTLTISVTPSFATKWLLPRLPSFYEEHTDIDLRISATVALTDFRRDKVDFAIRLGHGSYPGLHAEPLFDEALTPLCSPGLLARKGPLERPDDLRKHRLIHDTSIPGGGDHGAWKRWLNVAGADKVVPYRGDRFTLAEHAMQAAIDGAGVVLGRITLAEGDLVAGRLVRPFKTVLPLDVSYFLVRSGSEPIRREMQCFRDWLLGSIRRSRDVSKVRPQRSATQTSQSKRKGP